MPIPSIPPALPMPIANSGDVNDIPVTTPTGTGQLSFQAGFPFITQVPLLAGGIAPSRPDFNAAMKLLSQHTFFSQSGGVYPWQGADGDFAGLNYLAGWHVLGSNGHEYIAKLPSGPDVPATGGGFVGPKDPVEDGGTYWRDIIIDTGGVKYELCEFYYFRHPILRAGFQPAQGGVVANAATLYPDAWAYLQTVEGQVLCRTEAEWQVMTTAIWHTNADGSTVGWDGIGGAPFYVQDLAAGTLRLPDLRGMYAEAAGYDSLDVGGTHGDGVRNIHGWFGQDPSFANNPLIQKFGEAMSSYGGAFGAQLGITSSLADGGGVSYAAPYRYVFNSYNVVPTGAANKPRAWGALACVYLGAPAS